MSDKPDDGGPAFPVKVGRDNLPLQVSNDQFIMPGMSLRDYIAIAAMNGSLGGAPGAHLVPHTLARDSYEMADAMMKARTV